MQNYAKQSLQVVNICAIKLAKLTIYKKMQWLILYDLNVYLTKKSHEKKTI